MALLAALAAWPWVAPRYFVFLASLVLVNVIVAIGLNLLSGYTNQLSFGHAGFLAIGAYTAALVTIHAPAVPVPATLLLAGALTAAVGLAFGVPCLRLGGLYLSMATLAFGFVITEAILNLDGLTKGADGLRVPLARLGPVALGTDRARYYLAAVVAALMVAAAVNLVRTRPGRAFLACAACRSPPTRPRPSASPRSTRASPAGSSRSSSASSRRTPSTCSCPSTSW